MATLGTQEAASPQSIASQLLGMIRNRQGKSECAEAEASSVSHSVSRANPAVSSSDCAQSRLPQSLSTTSPPHQPLTSFETAGAQETQQTVPAGQGGVPAERFDGSMEGPADMSLPMDSLSGRFIFDDAMQLGGSFRGSDFGGSFRMADVCEGGPIATGGPLLDSFKMSDSNSFRITDPESDIQNQIPRGAGGASFRISDASGSIRATDGCGDPMAVAQLMQEMDSFFPTDLSLNDMDLLPVDLPDPSCLDGALFDPYFFEEGSNRGTPPPLGIDTQLQPQPQLQGVPAAGGLSSTPPIPSSSGNAGQCPQTLPPQSQPQAQGFQLSTPETQQAVAGTGAYPPHNQMNYQSIQQPLVPQASTPGRQEMHMACPRSAHSAPSPVSTGGPLVYYPGRTQSAGFQGLVLPSDAFQRPRATPTNSTNSTASDPTRSGSPTTPDNSASRCTRSASPQHSSAPQSLPGVPHSRADSGDLSGMLRSANLAPTAGPTMQLQLPGPLSQPGIQCPPPRGLASFSPSWQAHASPVSNSSPQGTGLPGAAPAQPVYQGQGGVGSHSQQAVGVQQASIQVPLKPVQGSGSSESSEGQSPSGEGVRSLSLRSQFRLKQMQQQQQQAQQQQQQQQHQQQQQKQQMMGTGGGGGYPLATGHGSYGVSRFGLGVPAATSHGSVDASPRQPQTTAFSPGHPPGTLAAPSLHLPGGSAQTVVTQHYPPPGGLQGPTSLAPAMSPGRQVQGGMNSGLQQGLQVLGSPAPGPGMPMYGGTEPSETASSWNNIDWGVAEKFRPVNTVMEQMLMRCAIAVDKGDVVEAQRLMASIFPMVSSHGNAEQRMGFYFLEGLAARIVGTGSAIYKELQSKQGQKPGLDSKSLLTAALVFFEATPWVNFGHVVANGSILEAVEGASEVHIIDFGITHGTQWPTLIEQLASRPGGPPHLRITGIDAPNTGLKPSSLQETGRRLSSFARVMGVPFEFTPITQHLDNLQAENFEIRGTEVLVVNCMMRLHQLPDDSGSAVAPSPRNFTLHLIRSLQPKLVALVEQSAEHNVAAFVVRFREAMHYMAGHFEALAMALPWNSTERALVEERVFGRKIINMVACEGKERIERHESNHVWQERMFRAGFKPKAISADVLDNAQMLLRRYQGYYGLRQDQHALLLTWKGHEFFAASTWGC